MVHPRASHYLQSRMNANDREAFRKTIRLYLASICGKYTRGDNYPWRVKTSWGNFGVRIDRHQDGCYGVVSHWWFSDESEAVKRLKDYRPFIQDCNGTFPLHTEGRAVYSRMKRCCLLNQWRHFESDLFVFVETIRRLTK